MLFCGVKFCISLLTKTNRIMKTTKLLLLSLLMTIGVFSQKKDIKSFCTEEIKKLDENYESLESEYSETIKLLDSLKKQLDVSVTDALLDEIKNIDKLKQNQRKGLFDVVSKFKNFQAVCELNDEEIKALFDHPNMNDFLKDFNMTEENSKEDEKVYLYFGENKVINEEILTKDNKQTEILKQIIREKTNDNYLGDITIPKDGKEFYFYTYIDKHDRAKKSTKFEQYHDAVYKFRNLHIEVSEGVFSDIRVVVETEDGNTHVYENQIGVSILRFSAVGKQNFLFYKHSIKKGSKSNRYNNKKMSDLFIKLTDVFVYDYKLGNHYAPSDLVLELPLKDGEGNSTNKDNFATYKIKEDSRISTIVELRTYTDFLALFGDSDNGLVQIEGKADIFVLPFPLSLPFFHKINLVEVKLFNKVSPRVNYSRFDEDNRYVVSVLDSITGDYIVQKELDLIEKRYLTMGIDLDVFQLKGKGFPVTFDLFGSLNYQLTEINNQGEFSNVKAVSYGPGARLTFKKFNNFGFNYSASFSWYDYKNFNEGLGILPEKFRVFSNEIEVFYYPLESKSQSIFLRLKTFNNSEPRNNEAFYQFQFGYRFAIGTKSIKKS